VNLLGSGRPGPDGRLIVLVPGLGAPGYLLRTTRRCAAHGPVRLLDLPGYDNPGGPVCPSALAPLAATVARWLTGTAGPPVVLAGHSTGAQVALRAATLAPERVHALVLLAPTFPPALRRPLPLARAFARTAWWESPAVLPTLLPSYARAGVPRLVRYLRSAQADAPEDTLPTVTHPVTVAGGEHDALSPPDWIRTLADRAPHGTPVLLPGAHAFPHADPHTTAALLTRAAGGRADDW
jgi:pimeloyl-ACP methyl ester carboxylesterase